MYGDFSRVFDARSGRYSAVLAQQGRFLLDAELNEQSAIVLDYLRRLTTDLIGPFAGPAFRAGFAVEAVGKGKTCHAVKLGGGHYYVYGLRCEPEAAGVEIAVDDREAPFVVYIVVWEQTVGAIQAPELVEPALGLSAADTACRTQIRTSPQLAKHLPGASDDLTQLEPEQIVEAFHDHNADPLRRPRMGARAHSTARPDSGPSIAPTTAAYRGVENQLYRVEVHRGGDAEHATFKWSRDNASVALALEKLSDLGAGGERTATLVAGWRDARDGLQPGDWVELVDDGWGPFSSPPALMRVQAVSLATREVTLVDTEAARICDPCQHPFLRRWDQTPDEEAACHGIGVGVAEGCWFELEDGVQVQFEAHERHHYQRGDYWMIPARTATRGVLWPLGNDDRRDPLALPPHGPTRYRAPLALVTSLSKDPIDLRSQFGYQFHEPESKEAESFALAADVDDPGVLTVIRGPEVSYRLRSAATFAPGAVFDVREGVMVIGREAGSDIHIEHPDVSRHHANLSASGTDLAIEDVGSRNGTRVNGKVIDAITDLKDGDVITVGPTEVQLKVELAAEAPP